MLEWRRRRVVCPVMEIGQVDEKHSGMELFSAEELISGAQDYQIDFRYESLFEEFD